MSAPFAAVDAVTRLRVHNLAVSLDGFATGDNPSFEAPFGHAGMRLMEWLLPTRTFVSTTGHDNEATGRGIGAEIMGRGKFGP